MSPLRDFHVAVMYIGTFCESFWELNQICLTTCISFPDQLPSSRALEHAEVLSG